MIIYPVNIGIYCDFLYINQLDNTILTLWKKRDYLWISLVTHFRQYTTQDIFNFSTELYTGFKLK